MKQQANLTSELYDTNFKSKLKINLEAQFMKPSRVPVSTLTGMDAKSFFHALRPTPGDGCCCFLEPASS